MPIYMLKTGRFSYKNTTSYDAQILGDQGFVMEITVIVRCLKTLVSWRKMRLISAIIACVLITLVLVEYVFTINSPARHRSVYKADQHSPSPRWFQKLDEWSPKLYQSAFVQKQMPKEFPHIYSRSFIKHVRQVFPLDSRPPDSLFKDFIIENTGVCNSVLSVAYIIVVHSAPDHFERRQSMRLTWTKQNLFKNTNSQRIFLLGKTLDTTLQGKIIEENKEYGDIVQGDFIDHYRNLTLKAVMGLKWIVKNCRHADYIIKVDDDVFVNIFQVKKTIFPLLKSKPMQIVCSVEPHAWIIRSRNLTTVKWNVSKIYFNGENRYPMPFCYGYATFYTTALASELLNVAYSTPFFRLDDVYVYGILMSKIKSASWLNEQKRYSKYEKATFKMFLSSPNSLVGTVRSSCSMQMLWKFVLKDLISLERRTKG